MLFWQLIGMTLLLRHRITTRRILADVELTRRPVHHSATRGMNNR
jgi:hypothetical protein